VIKEADLEDKTKIYAGLNLRLTYQPAEQIVRAEVNLDPHAGGAMVCVRGGTAPVAPRSGLGIAASFQTWEPCE
jgi:hypothetical protein